MSRALTALEADGVHGSCGYGGSVDADREMRVLGKGLSLDAPRDGSPGENLLHQIRSDRNDDTAVMAKPLGSRRRAAISSPGRAVFSMVSSTSQTSPPRSRSRRIRPTVSCRRSACLPSGCGLAAPAGDGAAVEEYVTAKANETAAAYNTAIARVLSSSEQTPACGLAPRPRLWWKMSEFVVVFPEILGGRIEWGRAFALGQFALVLGDERLEFVKL